ncbi:MAG: hypothetical protein A2135_00270 [Actinobacteria bacterium RBG_16_67_15]|nr:MAG: hypothetical protein A2135_00270 [Actinobacteria bacterium RBG_16_67_15]
MPIRPRHLIIGLVILLTVAACGDDESPGGSDDGDRYTHATGPTDVVVRISYRGGGPPPGSIIDSLGSVPHVVLYGDGTLIMPDYATGALPGLEVYALTGAGIRMVLEAADRAGLMDGGMRLGPEGVSDAPYASIRVEAGGQSSATSIVDPWDEGNADRRRIREFEKRFGDVAGWLGAEAVPVSQGPIDEVIAVFVQLDDPFSFGAPNYLEWPLDDPGDPAVLPGRYQDEPCLLISGADLDTARAVFAAADDNTLWTIGDEIRNIVIRPVYPDGGCGS